MENDFIEKTKNEETNAKSSIELVNGMESTLLQ